MSCLDWFVRVSHARVCLEEVGLKLAASIMLARLSEEVGETRSNRTQTQFAVGSGKGNYWAY